VCAYLCALILAAAIGYALIHVPFQVSDNLGNLLALQDGRSMWQLFQDTLTLKGFMRPASWATTKAVFDMSGGHYFVAYRSLHIAMVVLLLCALVRLLRVRSSTTLCLALLSIAALVGFHPFHDAVRETELNMKLLLPLICMAALILADSPHRLWNDAAVLALTAYGLLANELGILVWVTLVAGYLVGLRGVSGRALIAPLRFSRFILSSGSRCRASDRLALPSAAQDSASGPATPKSSSPCLAAIPCPFTSITSPPPR
jgi:hypothetical protein